MENLAEFLQSQGSQYRPIVVLVLEMELGTEKIEEWVHWCKNMGYGGFALIAGSRCNEPMVSEAWIGRYLDAVEYAVEQAAEAGLEVWIFDEWGYPSGTAAGLVSQERSLRSKRLHVALDMMLEPGQQVRVEVPEQLVAAGVIPVNKFVFYAPAGPCRTLSPKPGEILEYTAGETAERLVLVTWEYVSFLVHSIREISPEDPTLATIDLLNPAAARRFLKEMHQRYESRISRYFGNVVKGFFYDEPEASYDFPWTPGLEADFIQKKEYDLRDNLPLLMVYQEAVCYGGDPAMHQLVRKLMDDYYDVWTDRMADSFYGELENWCHQRGLLSIGHQDLDNMTRTLVSVSGHFFKNSSRNDHPGIDVIWDNIKPGRFDDFPRFAGSVKHLLGKNRSMSESFAEMGMSMHADLMRYIMEHQVIRGVDQFFLMISTLADGKEHMSVFNPGKAVNDTFGEKINRRVGNTAALSQWGIPGAETVLFVPMMDIHREQARMRNPHVENEKPLPWDTVDEIARFLTYLPVDFDYIWDEALKQLEVTEGGFKAAAGHIIRTVILPAHCSLKPDTVKQLMAFTEAGGRVITMGMPREELEGKAEHCHTLRALKSYLKTPFSIKACSPSLSLCSRKKDGKTLYMLLNESEDRMEAEMEFGGKGQLMEVDLLTGTVEPVCGGDSLKVEACFEGGQLRAFLAGSLEETGNSPSKSRNGMSRQLGGWKLLLPNGSDLQLDGELRDWTELGWPTFSGQMAYRTEFIWEGEEDGKAVLDLGEVCYAAVVYLDGKKLDTLPFAPYRLVMEGLEAGSHCLEIQVYNTEANSLIGTSELRQNKFKDKMPQFLRHDMVRLASGLLGPVTMVPFTESK